MELVRSLGILPVNMVLQVDGSRNEEDTGGGPILGKDDGTEDLDTDQPEDHYIDRLLVSLVWYSCGDSKCTTD